MRIRGGKEIGGAKVKGGRKIDGMRRREMEGEVRKLKGGGKGKVLFIYFLYRLWWHFVYAKTLSV